MRRLSAPRWSIVVGYEPADLAYGNPHGSPQAHVPNLSVNDPFPDSPGLHTKRPRSLMYPVQLLSRTALSRQAFATLHTLPLAHLGFLNCIQCSAHLWLTHLARSNEGEFRDWRRTSTAKPVGQAVPKSADPSKHKTKGKPGRSTTKK
jgi:hypothetical protein